MWRDDVRTARCGATRVSGGDDVSHLCRRRTRAEDLLQARNDDGADDGVGRRRHRLGVRSERASFAEHTLATQRNQDLSSEFTR